MQLVCRMSHLMAWIEEGVRKGAMPILTFVKICQDRDHFSNLCFLPPLPNFTKKFCVRYWFTWSGKEDSVSQNQTQTQATSVNKAYGSFTLQDTETDTDTNKVCTESNENLHQSLSLGSMNTSTEFYTSDFLSVSISVSAIVNTPLNRNHWF